MPSWFRAALALFAVGWGANQFAALLPVYREVDGATAGQVTALFGAYAVGLVPALLLVAPVSDRIGRGRVLRPVLVLSFVATVVLMVGGHSLTLLLVGRLLGGVASGAAFAPGTAWVKELSDAAPGTGARRAAIALSAGFGTGPLVTGVLAQWAPAPTVLPYVPHLVLTVAVAVLLRPAPEPDPADVATSDPDAATLRQVLGSRRFLTQVVPTAPWVFGTATLAFATLPAVVDVPGPSYALVGALVFLTLGTGVALQPYGRRLATGVTLAVGMGAGVAGFGVGALAATTGASWLVVPACMLLGTAYGFVLVAGLRTVETITPARDLATVNAVFYSLTYVGFAAPYLATLLLSWLDGTQTMLLLAGLTAASALVALAGRGASATR
ncbi:MFS transporter [Aeromicrobium sp. 50.2.37]|uniref:MFS transporter n=1 Tax=Aeromicrobium sp. 50.2.37 TaxID=2969305 RepID=UPI00214F99B1|nr:MFS transporter [Aeromicrobium sp. 50.2.37]MCR4512016.1 MFS transporter [Aeromicrobium sp. 50.2.37]